MFTMGLTSPPLIWKQDLKIFSCCCRCRLIVRPGAPDRISQFFIDPVVV